MKRRTLFASKLILNATATGSVSSMVVPQMQEMRRDAISYHLKTARTPRRMSAIAGLVLGCLLLPLSVLANDWSQVREERAKAEAKYVEERTKARAKALEEEGKARAKWIEERAKGQPKWIEEREKARAKAIEERGKAKAKRIEERGKARAKAIEKRAKLEPRW